MRINICLVVLACGLTIFILNLLLVNFFEFPNAKKVHLNRKPFVSSSALPDSLIQYQQYLQDIYRGHAYPIHMKPSEFVSRNRPEHPIDFSSDTQG